MYYNFKHTYGALKYLAHLHSLKPYILLTFFFIYENKIIAEIWFKGKHILPKKGLNSSPVYKSEQQSKSINIVFGYTLKQIFTRNFMSTKWFTAL